MNQIIWDDNSTTNLWNHYSGMDEKAYFSYHSGKSLISFCSSKGVVFQNKTVLDFSCGNGYLYEYLRKYKVSYYGCDFSEESVKHVRQKHPEAEADAIKKMPLKYKDNYFDIIFLNEVIEHVYDEQLNAYFNELKRVLSPQGVIVITTPNKENLEASFVYCPHCNSYFHKWQHVRRWDSKLLNEKMKDFGFEPRVFCGAIDFDIMTDSIIKRAVRFVSRVHHTIKGNYCPRNLIYIGQIVD